MLRVKKVSARGDYRDRSGSDSPVPSDATAKMGDSAAHEAIICPVCGAVTAQEKCKVVCHSNTCRGRIIMNCSEF